MKTRYRRYGKKFKKKSYSKYGHYSKRLTKLPYVQPEVKFLDRVWTQHAVPIGVQFCNVANTWSFDTPIGLTQGAGQSDRVGKKIKLLSILIKGTVKVTTTATSSGTVHFYIIQDRIATGTFPAVADIWSNSTLQPDQFMRNINYTKRFKIMCEKKYFLQVTEAGQSLEYPFECFLKFGRHGMTINYEGATNAITEIKGGNSLYLACGSSQNTDDYELKFTSRIRYLD